MKAYILIPFVFFLIIFSSCHEPCTQEDNEIIDESPTNPAHKEFVPYKLNDVVTFSDDLGNQAVYTCTYQRIKVDTTFDGLYHDRNECSFEYRTPNYHVVLESEDVSDYLEFVVSSIDESRFKMEKNGYWSSYIDIDDPCKSISCDSIKVNDKWYYDVMKLWPDSYYTVNHGLIQFKDDSGRIWGLVE